MDISTVSKDEIRETYFKTVSKNKVVVFLATNNFSTLTRTINNNKNNHIQTIEEYMEVLNLDNWLDIEKLNPITNEFFVIEFNSEEKGLDFIKNLDTEYPDYCCLYIDGKFRYENT